MSPGHLNFNAALPLYLSKAKPPFPAVSKGTLRLSPAPADAGEVPCLRCDLSTADERDGVGELPAGRSAMSLCVALTIALCHAR